VILYLLAMDNQCKKISIITPCFNAENYIKETIESVLCQTAILSQRVELEYIICDGNSSDRTLSIIQSLSSDYVKLISENDLGIYSALAKGLQLSTGDVTAYLNAGDYYHKCAFDIILDLFESKHISWLTGYTVAYNERSQLVGVKLPYKYRRRFFDCGFYIKKLPCVQQESTFWSSDLNALLDYDFLSKLQYAGDYYLWKQFSQKETLNIVEAYLGGFRHHKGQISENLDAYCLEVKSMCALPNMYDWILAYLDKILWYMPSKVKKLLNPKNLFRFDHNLQMWM
jgi:glycosyltransferase involved in cell wall biosynthesis